MQLLHPFHMHCLGAVVVPEGVSQQLIVVVHVVEHEASMSLHSIDPIPLVCMMAHEHHSTASCPTCVSVVWEHVEEMVSAEAWESLVIG